MRSLPQCRLEIRNIYPLHFLDKCAVEPLPLALAKEVVSVSLLILLIDRVDLVAAVIVAAFFSIVPVVVRFVMIVWITVAVWFIMIVIVRAAAVVFVAIFVKISVVVAGTVAGIVVVVIPTVFSLVGVAEVVITSVIIVLTILVLTVFTIISQYARCVIQI